MLTDIYLMLPFKIRFVVGVEVLILVAHHLAHRIFSVGGGFIE